MGCFRIIFFPFFIMRRLLFGKGVSSIGIPLQVLDKYRYDLRGRRADGELLWIQGRPPFLIAFFLSLLGLAPRPSVRVTRKEVHFMYQTAFSESHLVVPLEDITVADCRYEKPIWRLYLGCFSLVAIVLGSLAACVSVVLFGPLFGNMFENIVGQLDSGSSSSYSSYSYSLADFAPILGVCGATLIPLIFVGILLFTYWRSKRVSITFSTGNIDGRAGLAFSRTWSKDINYEEFVKVFQLINRYIIEAHYARFDNPLSVKDIATMRTQEEALNPINVDTQDEDE